MPTICSAPLGQSVSLHAGHHLTSSWCGYHFIFNASRVTSFSSTDSASGLFRLAFSASGPLNRFASETSIHAAKPVAPEVVTRLGEAVLAAQLLHRHAGIHLPQKANDLLLGTVSSPAQPPSLGLDSKSTCY